MRRVTLAVVLCGLLVGCSGAGDGSAGDVAPTTGVDDDAAPGAGAAASGDTPVLLAAVGTPEDPEAFVIVLTDEDGTTVTELPAGEYVIEVSDPAATHNVHLTGPGVDEATSVAGTEDATWQVTLEPGEYTYTCDPHPSMTGTFTVT